MSFQVAQGRCNGRACRLVVFAVFFIAQPVSEWMFAGAGRLKKNPPVAFVLAALRIRRAVMISSKQSQHAFQKQFLVFRLKRMLAG